VSSQNKFALSCEYVPDAPANTTEPVVNAVDVPVPPLATGSVPVTPVVSGSPVAFVSVADAGVPSAITFPAASS
jgi:hypothetical protein